MNVNGYEIAPNADLSGANLSSANLSSADLSGANLRGANLRSADLSYANLSYANLRGANLSYANLSYANLSSANLSYANLSSANLSSADLSGANLRGANLRSADLSYANLSYANLRGAKNISELIAAQLNICPAGSLIVYKKAQEGIVTLLIPGKAARSNATGRKCRAEFAIVRETPDHKPAHSRHDPAFLYVEGETVRPDTWNADRWQECAGGVHFFLTRIEAEKY